MNQRWHARPLSRALSRLLSLSFTTSASPTAGSFPLKNVTKSNFASALAELRHHVKAADFVAIDLEMTGITSAPWRESFEFDRFDVRYFKLKDSAEKFAVVQLGVCPFRWDQSKQSFIAHPHNFYVFPRQELKVDGPSQDFLCQASSIDFLAKYQFDFNLCIREGISYLSRAQEEEALRCINLTYKNELSDNVKDFRDGEIVNIVDVLFSERMKNKFSEWRDGLLERRNEEGQFKEASNGLKRPLETIFFKMRPAICLNGFTSHQQRLIKLVIRKYFDDLAYVRVNRENEHSQQLVVYTDSNSDRDSLMEEVRDEQLRVEKMRIQSAIGIRHVIDLLLTEQKLIVGHNCFLDIAHIYSKFNGPLPSTVEEFVSSVSKYLKYIVDTKLLLNVSDVLQQRMKKSSTSLSSAFALLCPQFALGSKSTGLGLNSCMQVEVQVDDLRSSNWNSGAKHEAGYDAFMTGCVFAQACSHLGVGFKLHSSSENLALNEKLQKYINHLYLSGSNSEIIELSTGKRVTESLTRYNSKRYHSRISFEKVVLIWGFSSKLTPRKIKECLCKVFGSTAVTYIYQLDETSVFLEFSQSNLVSDFLRLKKSLETQKDAIAVLHPLAEVLSGGQTRAADYETYKDICSSPISKTLFADQAEAVGFKEYTKLLQSNVEREEQEVISLDKTDDDLIPEKCMDWKAHNGKDDASRVQYETLQSVCAADGN